MHLQFKFELPGRIQVNGINLLNIANKIKKLQILICTIRYNSKPREKNWKQKKKKIYFAEGTETTLGKVILCRGPNSDPRQNRRQVKAVCLPSQVADGLSLPTAGPSAKGTVAERNYLSTAWPSANMVLPTAYRCRGPTLGKPFFAESPTFGSRQRRWLLATGLFPVVCAAAWERE